MKSSRGGDTYDEFKALERSELTSDTRTERNRGPCAEATQGETREEDCEGGTCQEVGGKQKTHVVEAERGSAERGTAIRPFAAKGVQVSTVGGMEITVTWIRADTFPLEKWEIPLQIPPKGCPRH